MVKVLIFWVLVIAGLISGVVFVNQDYNPEDGNGWMDMIASSHDGTLQGRVNHWLNSVLREWNHKMTQLETELPEMLQTAWIKSVYVVFYTIRGICLGCLRLTIAACDMIGLDLSQDIESGRMEIVLQLAGVNACLILLGAGVLYHILVNTSSPKPPQQPPSLAETSRENQSKTGSSKPEEVPFAKDAADNRKQDDSEFTGEVPPAEELMPKESLMKEGGGAHMRPSASNQNQNQNGNQMQPQDQRGSQQGTGQSGPQGYPINPKEQGKSLEMLANDQDPNMDLKTEAMLAYINDCEAYDEEELRRQNEELRQQISVGPEKYFEMRENKDEQIEKLTRGMMKMLNQVKKESKFSGYALETLKAEKQIVNEELQRLLSMNPDELAQIKSDDMFKQLRSRVQRFNSGQKSGSVSGSGSN